MRFAEAGRVRRRRAPRTEVAHSVYVCSKVLLWWSGVWQFPLPVKKGAVRNLKFVATDARGTVAMENCEFSEAVAIAKQIKGTFTARITERRSCVLIVKQHRRY
jgi:hypothetical protein